MQHRIHHDQRAAQRGNQADRQASPTRRRGHGVGQVAYGGDDAEAARPPGRGGDCHERQHHAKAVAGGQAGGLDDRLQVKAVLLDQALGEGDDAEGQRQTGTEAKQ